MDTPRRRNVVSQIVSHQMCIGCGLCAGICPAECLEMKFNEFGEYNPYFVDSCIECNRCLKVCPFYDSDWNEDTLAQKRFGHVSDIHHTVETGFYSQCYVGRVTSDKLLQTRSSGGLASWFLAQLLNKGIVDRIACVVPNPQQHRLFNFCWLDSPKDVYHSSTSCYYPVELSKIIREISNNTFSCAIIGLPCFLKGLSKAMEQDRSLSDRIKVLVGLVCSHGKSQFYSEYLIRLAGGDPEFSKRVDFRRKKPDQHLHHYEFVCHSMVNSQLREFTISSGAFDWELEYFKINACNYCDDIFAEVADIAFMDAWLPEYMCRPGGMSLSLVRSRVAGELLEQGRSSGELFLEPVKADKVIQSQRNKLRTKRKLVPIRLAFAQRQNRWVPRKRVQPRLGCRPDLWLDVFFTLRRIAASRISMVRQKQKGIGLNAFHQYMTRRLWLDRLIWSGLIQAKKKMKWLFNKVR